MARFESGVKSYVTGTVTLDVHFPIDGNGREHINCMQCPYLSNNSRICNLNKQPVAFPEKFIGDNCPLERKD